MIIYARYIGLAFVSFCSAVIMVSLLRHYYFANTINCLCFINKSLYSSIKYYALSFLEFVSECVTLNRINIKLISAFTTHFYETSYICIR